MHVPLKKANTKRNTQAYKKIQLNYLYFVNL